MERVEADEDISELFELVEMHLKYTGSTVADRVLQEWPAVVDDFVKVMPTDYKRVLMERAEHDEEMEAAVKYETSNEFLDLPEVRYGACFSWNAHKYTTFSFELLQCVFDDAWASC